MTAADVRDVGLTYAAGDVVGYVTPLGVTPPIDADVELDSPPWYCLGWIETTGVTYKPTRSLKEVTAAGSLSSIRTVVISEVKTMSAIFLEALNPWVRALFDDVPIGQLAPGRADALTSTTSASPVVFDGAVGASDVGKVVAGTGITAGTTVLSVDNTSTRVDSTGTATTSGSATVGDTHAVAGDLGQGISGTGVPAGATIVAVVPGTGYTISALASVTGTPTLTVNIFSYTLSANATATGHPALSIGEGSSRAGYILPEVRQVNQYAFCFDSFDGDKKVRLFGVRGQVNNPGDEQLQQADTTNTSLEITFYPDNITLAGATKRGTIARYIDYGAENNVATYFP